MKLKKWQNKTHVIVNAKLIVQHVIQIKNGIMKHFNESVKIIVIGKKNYSWNPSRRIYDNGKYLKRVADTSVIACDEVIYVIDTVSAKMANTIATNVSMNSSKKRRHKVSYILHTVLLVIILLFIIASFDIIMQIISQNKKVLTQ